MQDEIRHGAAFQVRSPLNQELLFLVETSIESIGLGRPRLGLSRPGSLDGLWHAKVSLPSVR